MKSIIIIIFLFISTHGFCQITEHYRDSIFFRAQNSLKKNNIEEAYRLYSYGSRFFNDKQLKKSIKKTDSIRPILRQKLLKNILGKWNLDQSFYKTKLQSIEIFNDKIHFNEGVNVPRIEEIVFENDLKYMKNYFEIIFSDNTKWFFTLENDYLTLEFVSHKTQNGDLGYSDNNDQYVFKR